MTSHQWICKIRERLGGNTALMTDKEFEQMYDEFHYVERQLNEAQDRLSLLYRIVEHLLDS
mgnify:CR=1 FL=1